MSRGLGDVYKRQDDIKTTGGMWVPPHPHTGLQTVTWLFEGLGLHTDSLGSHQLIRPGQLNVMTAGHGICHAEVSPEDAPDLLHGGEPFEEEIVMWWNFIGRSHEEIVEQRAAWNGAGLHDEPERFGAVKDFDGDRLLAPPMPNTRLKPRGRSA